MRVVGEGKGGKKGKTESVHMEPEAMVLETESIGIEREWGE